MFDLDPGIRAIELGRSRLVLDRPRIMAILNLTPDSFSDGGRHADANAAIDAALRMVEEGADLIDVGGESTRPGAAEVGELQELDRVIPVIEGLRARSEVAISIDTSKPAVMRAAVAAGAGLINDVRALRAGDALEAAAASGAAVCLMHMQGTPADMQAAPHYDDVVADVHRFLAERIFACEMSGIAKKKLLVDPGFGFGKTLDHNLALLKRLEKFKDLGLPLVAGLSRKGMLGAITGREVGDRLAGSVAAALLAVDRGADIVRVHDVAATRDALAVWMAARVSRAPVKAAGKPVISWPDDD